MTLRRLLKRLAFVISVVVVSPVIAAAWAEKKVLGKEVVFVGFGQMLALVPGTLGAFLRGAYYYGTLEGCSWEIHVGFGSIFTHRGASLGKNVSMGAYCVIGHADISDDVMMASRISIPSGKRQHFDDEGQVTPHTRYDRVRIGSNCWIGEGAIIMADVGRRCVVSAGAVIIKQVPDACIVGGNPAKVIRELGQAGSTPSEK